MNYLEKQDDILMELDKAVKTDKEFEFLYKDFEGQKVCHLSLNTFLLKPGQRLLHYKLLLESKWLLLKVSYLPLNTFLLKPGQRLLHYKLLLESKWLLLKMCFLPLNTFLLKP